MPRIVKIQRAVSSVPATGVVVAERIADVVARPLITLRNLTAHLHFRRRGYVPTKASNKRIVQNVTQQAVEIARAAAVEERCLRGNLAGSSVVAGVGDAEVVSGHLTLWTGEGRWTQAAWA